MEDEKKWPHQTVSPSHSTYGIEKEGKHLEFLRSDLDTGHNPALMERPDQLQLVPSFAAHLAPLPEYSRAFCHYLCAPKELRDSAQGVELTYSP